MELKNRITQVDMVYKYMKNFGSITSWEAFSDLGVTRLSDKIYTLRNRGIRIDSSTESTINRYGTQVFYSRYFIQNAGQQ